MEKYNRKRSNCIQMPICDKTVTSEITGDYTLPDYQPEIKRLIRVNACVLPPSKYVNDRQAELAGNIDYYVIYTGSDNCVYCAPLSAEYKLDVPVEQNDLGENAYISDYSEKVTVIPDMISGRVTAPRKICVKCRLKARAQIFGDTPLEDNVSEQDEDIQSLIGERDTVRNVCVMGDMISLSDEMICENREEDLRVVLADGRVLIGEVGATGDSVSCRGDLYLKLLLCRDDGSSPYTVMRKIPVSQVIPLEGAEANSGLSARGYMTEMNITVEEGRIGLAAGVMIEVEACLNESVRYVKDVYSTYRKADNKYKTLPVSREGSAVCGNFTLSDSRSLEEVGLSATSRIIDISGIAGPEEYDLEGGKCAILGKSKFSLLVEKDGEYSSTEIELPFSYKTSATGHFDRAHFACDIISARTRIDGERIGIDAEVLVSGIASSYENEEILSSVGFGEALERERGEFVICYPSLDDSLWTVAKRYGAKINSLAENNGIEDFDSPDDKNLLKDIKYLVV